MKVNVRAFGIAKDIFQKSSTEIELAEGSSVMDLKKEIESRFPDFRKLKHYHIALNEDYAQAEAIIKDQDEIVIIPPVSGG